MPEAARRSMEAYRWHRDMDRCLWMPYGAYGGLSRRLLGLSWRPPGAKGKKGRFKTSAAAVSNPRFFLGGASWVALGASGALMAPLGPLRRRPGHPPGGHFGLPGVLFARSAEK